MRLDIIELQVNNWKSMVEWYKKLGFTIKFREDDHQFALLSSDNGVMIGLYGAEPKISSNFIPYIKVEDIEVTVNQLKSKKIEVNAVEKRHWGKRAKIIDLERNTLYLYEEERSE